MSTRLKNQNKRNRFCYDKGMSKSKFGSTGPASISLVSAIPAPIRLRLAREHKGMTQSELAKEVHTLYQRVHEWESSWKKPSDKYYEKLAEVLDVDLLWLKEGRYDKTPRFLYETFSMDKNPITDEEYKFRYYLLDDNVKSLALMEYELLFCFSHLISTGLWADNVLNDPEFFPKKDGAVYHNLEFAEENAVLARECIAEIEKLIDMAVDKFKE